MYSALVSLLAVCVCVHLRYRSWMCAWLTMIAFHHLWKCMPCVCFNNSSLLDSVLDVD